ncbi:MAG: hypothetical protein CVV03_12025 [Firmicutes bacterium HGW-Firmicutes-8]|nr:MAG: hypothetical protein CVV03_12025 [Firmicutes bacterium HGW-Firmicutes-8]
MVGIEIFSKTIAYLVIGILFLFNIIPIYSAHFAVVKENTQTALYDFSPKEIEFNSYRMVIFRIEQDPKNTSKIKTVYNVFDPNKNVVSIKKMVVQAFKDINKLEIPIHIDYLNSEITFPVIDAPYTIKIKEIQLSDDSNIQRTYEIEQEILVSGFQKY